METNYYANNIKRITFSTALLVFAISIAASASPPPLAILEEGQITIVSGDTDGDGIIESNQEGGFKVSISNSAYSFDRVFDVTATLATSNPNVDIVDGNSSYGDIDTGITKDPIDNGFIFNVPDNFSGEIIFELAISYNDEESLQYTLSEPLYLNLSVERINHAPVLNPIGDKSVDEGTLLEFTISAIDIDGDNLDYSAGNLPMGAAFDENTHTFSWTPDYDQAGTYVNVHFEVSDTYLTDSEDITITVNNVPDQPGDRVVVSSGTEEPPGDGNTVTLTVAVEDASGNRKTEHSDYTADIVLSSNDATAIPSSILIPNGTAAVTVDIVDPKVETVTVGLNETSSTPLLEESGSATFIHGTPTIIELDIENLTPIADGVDTSSITVYVRDSDYNSIPSEPVVVDIVTGGGSVGSVTDVGDGSYTAVYTSGTIAETVTIRARDLNNPGLLTITMDIELQAGPLHHIIIEDEAGEEIDNFVMVIGEMLILYSRGYDQYGNSIGEISSTWSVSGGIGTIPPGPSASAEFTATAEGTGEITADDGAGHTYTTGPIIVTQANQPVAVYRFDEGVGHIANDEGGNESHGTIYGDSIDWTTGRIASALEFNESSDYVVCGNDVSLNIRNAITIIAWFKAPVDQSGRYNTLVAKADYHAYQLKTDTNHKIYASIWVNGTRQNIHGNTAFSLGEWHHFAVTFDGSVIKVYLDGNLDGSKSVTGTIDDSSQYDLLIGTPSSIGSSAYDARGTIDEVKIYDMVLLQDVIAADMVMPRLSDAPLVPLAPVGPASGDTGASYIFSASTTDPDGDRIKYVFDWGDGETSITPYYNPGDIATFSHTWTAAGLYDVKVKAMDVTRAESGWSNPVQIDILSGGTPPVIDLSITEIVTEEDQWEHLILSGHASDAEDPEEALVWSVTDVDTTLLDCFISSGTMQVQLHIHPLPDQNGQDAITLVLTDTDGLTDTHDLLVTVTPLNDPPVLNPIGDSSVNENELLDFYVTATDIDSQDLIYSAAMSDGSPLPEGASIDPVSGYFSWTPDYSQEGAYQIEIKVQDDGGLYDSEVITVTVIDVDIVIKIGGSNPDYGTIQEGIDNAQPGYTLHVYPGEYNEDISLIDGISVIGIDGRGSTIVNGKINTANDTYVEGITFSYELTQGNVGPDFCVLRIAASDVSIKDCGFELSYNYIGTSSIDYNYIARVFWGERIAIEGNNFFFDTYAYTYYMGAIEIGYGGISSDIAIRKNKISLDNNTRLWPEGNILAVNITDTDNIIIENNVIYAHGGDFAGIYGILFNRFYLSIGSSDNAVIKNNTIYLKGRVPESIYGIDIAKTPHLNIRNNIIDISEGEGVATCLYPCYLDGFDMGIDPILSFTYNIYNGQEEFLYLYGPTGLQVTQHENIEADPRFSNPLERDFHLMRGSPAIDRGDPNDDYSQEPNPNGGRINCGAYGNTGEATTSSSSGCFLAGTPILLPNEVSKPIEKIKVGDTLLAFDEKTGALKPDTVKHVFVFPNEEEYLIINDNLKVTPHHAFYVTTYTPGVSVGDGKWVEAGQLKTGDILMNSNDEPEKIASIRHVKENVTVYNLEVNPYHTFIAGGVVVHNARRPDPQGGTHELEQGPDIIKKPRL